MMSPGMLIRHPKARGEWAELRFMTRATGTRTPRHQALGRQRSPRPRHRGPRTLPQRPGQMHRFRRGRSYKCHLDSNGHAYTPDQIDFIAAYVIPTDTWYILPIEATNGQPDIGIIFPYDDFANSLQAEITSADPDNASNYHVIFSLDYYTSGNENLLLMSSRRGSQMLMVA